MKKLLSLIMVLMMILSLAACGGAASESPDEPAVVIPATVIDNEGNTVEMTAEDIMKADDNEAYFDKVLAGAEIVVEGIVEKVETNLSLNGSTTIFDTVELEEGWEIHLLHDSYDLAELAIGSKVRVSSNIYDTHENVNLRGCFYFQNQLVYSDSSLQTTEITVIE